MSQWTCLKKYKKSQIILDECTDIQGMSPENLRKMAHPDIAISIVDLISMEMRQ